MKGNGKRALAWGLWFHFWLVILTFWAGMLVIFWAYIDKNSPMIHRACQWWGRNLLRIAHIPVQVEGLEHLSPGQAYVFAANHRSNFDIFVLISVLPGRFLWVAKKALFHIPVLGLALSRMGSISVDRDNLRSAVQSLERATAVVKSGVSMIIFPEGTRATCPELLPFKKGVFIMAMKAGQPIVPVSISGTRFIQPPGVIRMRPGPIKVVISPPINPGAVKRKEELMAAVRQAIDARYDPDFPFGPGGRNS
ncbi:MAG: 1-acyl-sn-glycerol-3-phosphate acyltransferase [Syntrophobacterales bacterium]|jgi:1-acyl-sn-glycerol-3-phosphate acyltransferase|nr:1-acyl-sn-glycerol-3-phosphate acyltransferase [Syntrophobacterales bacterium]